MAKAKPPVKKGKNDKDADDMPMKKVPGFPTAKPGFPAKPAKGKGY